MEDLYNFNENKLNYKSKLLKVLFCVFIVLVILTITLIILTYNFSDKYGAIPDYENLTVGDKILYVLLYEGRPTDIEYNMQDSNICLIYSKTIYGEDSNVKMFFSKGRLSSLVYEFEEFGESDKYRFFENVVNNIEIDIGEGFSTEVDNQNCKAIWQYSTGAKTENIELVIEENSCANITVLFQY